MVKPQFEVGKERVGAGGVVRDPALRAEAVLDVAAAAAAARAGRGRRGRQPAARAERQRRVLRVVPPGRAAGRRGGGCAAVVGRRPRQAGSCAGRTRRCDATEASGEPPRCW